VSKLIKPIAPCATPCGPIKSEPGYLAQGLGLVTKPLAIAAGTAGKLLGSASSAVGDKIASAGQSMQQSGQGINSAGLGGLGLGASMLGWGMDSSTIHNQLQSSPQLVEEVSSLVKPIDALMNDEHPAAQTAQTSAQAALPMTQQAQTESLPQTESVNQTPIKPNV